MISNLPPVLTTLGLILDVLGAIGLALPDLVLRRVLTTPETLREARNQLYQNRYMIRGQADNDRIDAITEVVKENYEADIGDEVYQILLRKRRRNNTSDSLALVYDEDTDDKFLTLGAPDEHQLDDDLYDFIAQDSLAYRWIGDEIQRIEQRLRLFRTAGAIVLTVGFVFQLLSLYV